MAGHDRGLQRQVQHRQSVGEYGFGLVRAGDPLERNLAARRGGRQHVMIADDDEGRSALAQRAPGLDADLRTYPGRVAQA